MKRKIFKLLSVAALAVALLFTSCRSTYVVTEVGGRMQPIDSTFDVNPDAEAVALIAPYKAKIDSMMYEVVGIAEMSMEKGIPESLLSNIVADVLRESAKQVLGKPADMGLVNMGGLRNVLTEGPITRNHIFEILPFENSLCVVTIKGAFLIDLFENIAARGGEGVSGVQLQITKDGKLIKATVGGKTVEDDKLYTVATIDYLADGNDGMVALGQGEKRESPNNATLRSLFLKYVGQQTAEKKKIKSRIEGRITIGN